MRFIMFKDISQKGKAFALLAFFICSYAWGTCQTYEQSIPNSGFTDPNSYFSNDGGIHNYSVSRYAGGSFSFIAKCTHYGTITRDNTINLRFVGDGSRGYVSSIDNPHGCSCGYYDGMCYVYVNMIVCSNECEAKEHACAQDTTKVWNSDNCQCENKPPPPTTCSYCEDYVDYSTFPPVPKSKNYECLQCATDSNGVTHAAGCTLERDSDGTCEDNNDCPSGMICNDSTPNVDCYATVGSKVYLRDRKSGHVWGCDADGDCQMALRKYASGQCQDPNPPPNSSDSGGANSSSGGANSSSSDSPTSSATADGPWALESTLQENTAYAQKTAENTGDIANYTVTIMGKTSDIYNELIEHGITLNNIKDNTDDIKTNTGTTATNTGNIDNKLSRTNNLLDSINKKNWNPHIDVQPPEVTVNVQGDTNSVTVNVDTSHAPSEILGFLRGLFGGDTSGWNGDTTGWNGITDSVQNSFDSAIVKSDWLQSLNCDTTGGRKCDDKILGAHALDSATARLKSAYKVIGDTLKNGAFGDSLSNWGSKFTGGNVITGSGSNSCPSVLTRNYHVEIIQGAGFDMTLGTYLCNPIFGNVTAWTLCRLLLRATIALACMWFLFKCATGFRGQGGDDD